MPGYSSGAGFKRAWDTGVNNWLGPAFGSDYAVKVYVGNSGWNGLASSMNSSNVVEVIFGADPNADWFYDYEAGVLYWTNEEGSDDGSTTFDNSTDFVNNGVTSSAGTKITLGDIVYIQGYAYKGGVGVGSDSAATVTITEDDTASDHYLVFTSDAGSSQNLLIDKDDDGGGSSDHALKYDPGNNVLTLGAAVHSVSLTTGGLTAASITYNGTAITSTAVELNLLDNAVGGSIVNNKAVIYDAAGVVNATTFELSGTALAFTRGIADNNLLEVDGSPSNGEFAKFTANGLEGRTAANVLSDIGGLAASGAAEALNIDHLITLTGVAAASDNLGTFTGATINDSVTIKAALQALETKVEAVQTDVDGNESDADSAIAAVQADVDQNETDADQAIADLLDGSTDFTAIDVNGGNIDGATIATSNITVGSGKTLNVSAGTLTLADDQISGDKVEGGTINATTITTLTSGTIQATTLKANDGTAAGSIADTTGIVTLASSVLTTADINGGTIDATTIGASTAAAGSFTTIAASGDVTISGNLNVIGAGTYINLQQENVYMKDALITVGYVDGTDDDDFTNGSAAASDVGLEAYKQGHDGAKSPTLVYDISADYWAIDNKDHAASALTRVARTFKIEYTIDESGNSDVTNGYFTITHNLNHKDVIVQVRDASDNIVFFKYTSQTALAVRVAIGSGIADGDVFNVVVVG